MTTGLSLLFAAGQRPSVSDIVRFAETVARQPGFGIAHLPEPDQGWIELLAMGLTFDCNGIAPFDGKRPVRPRQLFGLPPTIEHELLETIDIKPGPHLSDGARLMPVVRGLVGLGAQLADLPGVQAVCWNPAQSWMEPTYFRRIIDDWLHGGAFPALGLTTLEQRPDGSMVSSGLAFLTGQELFLVPKAGATAAETAKLAVRVIDELVYAGPLLEPAQYAGPNGEELRAEPEAGGTLAWIEWVA